MLFYCKFEWGIDKKRYGRVKKLNKSMLSFGIKEQILSKNQLIEKVRLINSSCVQCPIGLLDLGQLHASGYQVKHWTSVSLCFQLESDSGERCMLKGMNFPHNHIPVEALMKTQLSLLQCFWKVQPKLFAICLSSSSY